MAGSRAAAQPRIDADRAAPPKEALEKAHFGHGADGVPNDEMVQEAYFNQRERITKPMGNELIRLRRRWVTRGMPVRAYDRRGAARQRFLDDFTRMDRCRLNRTAE